MSKNLFAKAVEDATLTITTSQDGSRSYGDNGNHGLFLFGSKE